MREEYIPVATSATKYYEPQNEHEVEVLVDEMNIGDMLFKKWIGNGMWYTLGLLDKDDMSSLCLFPNITMNNAFKQLTHYGLARMKYLQTHNKFLAMQFGTLGLHKHCLEIEKQANTRKQNMMLAIRKDPNNKVTERDKSQDPIAWAGRMNNFKLAVNEIIYAELIYS